MRLSKAALGLGTQGLVGWVGGWSSSEQRRGLLELSTYIVRTYT